MAIRSRNYRRLIVPWLCLGLLTWQFFLRDDAYASQINHIRVNRTASKFVAPVSQTTIANLDAMSHFANLAAPVSALPERNWILDESDVVPELAIHRPASVAGSVAGDSGEESGGVWWLDAASLLVAGVEFPAEFNEEESEIEAFEGLEAIADTSLYANIPPPQGTNTTKTDTDGPHFVEDIDEAAGTDLTETIGPGDYGPGPGTEYTVGGGRNYTKIVKENRALMLSYELDALVLGAF
jgi:hypothetical protein